MGNLDKKDPQLIQYMRVVDKLHTLVSELEDTAKLIPKKGDSIAECQRTYFNHCISILDMAITGLHYTDFAPNEYSGDFKLSYS